MIIQCVYLGPQLFSSTGPYELQYLFLITALYQANEEFSGEGGWLKYDIKENCMNCTFKMLTCVPTWDLRLWSLWLKLGVYQQIDKLYQNETQET